MTPSWREIFKEDLRYFDSCLYLCCKQRIYLHSLRNIKASFVISLAYTYICGRVRVERGYGTKSKYHNPCI